MGKRLIVLLIVLIMLTGCGASDSGTSEDMSPLQDTVKQQEKRIKELEAENDNLKLQLDNYGEVITTSSDGVTDKDEKNADVIEIGDVITTKATEITIKDIELSYDVLPDDTSGFYNHYPADSGNVYIHIKTVVKNLQKQNLPADEIMAVKADYNGGFTYNSMTVPEDSTGFTYANITSIKPLESLGVRFLIEAPEEVEETDNPLVLYFTIDNQIYKHVIR